ncbi:Crp/Fnr family transcriptional regulator (plasmid) [Rhizobium sophoriradicis]|uniref:Crp/Fnr family transcriptional regulator n=1 Tax=Rhizobium TaxID=379 RepID=UPI000581EB09|nr:Crp/Fnr family transcriptional regulator [Rhizobium sp. Kim5]AJC83359.1 Crp family transcriptional regulator protein [Rhizobium etli bv. phaseoli str. IE4803]ARQ62178.1 Crp family transcriptional regulator protein [Rhizobium sp. Kim5]UWU37537.1 Crp/Fnr family transcriptional regulator [Rhizobium leguminosarum bv. phaseoli]
MAEIFQERATNRLIRCLPDEAFRLVAAYLRHVDLPTGTPLVEANKPIEHVHFIESGLASMVTSSADGNSLEVGNIGYEGISGYPVLLGIDRTPNRTFMQVAGSGLKLSVSRFLSLQDNPEAHLLFLRYIHTRELQLAYSALAAARYHVHQRLARWLLMCHDRLIVDDMPLTHDFLALMLGVRRAGVTVQLHILEGMRAIKSTRGNVHIVDRRILLEVAGASYGVPEAEYERLIGSELASRERPPKLSGAGWSR